MKLTCAIRNTPGGGMTGLLAPSSPERRLAEAGAFALIAGDDWNALPAGDPQPSGPVSGKRCRKLDRGAAKILEEHRVKRHQYRSGANYSRPCRTCENTTSSRLDTRKAKRIYGGLTGGRDHFFSSRRGYDFGGLMRVAEDSGRGARILVSGSSGRPVPCNAHGLLVHVAGMPATLADRVLVPGKQPACTGWLTRQHARPPARSCSSCLPCAGEGRPAC